jgi:hypothetical protein
MRLVQSSTYPRTKGGRCARPLSVAACARRATCWLWPSKQNAERCEPLEAAGFSHGEHSPSLPSGGGNCTGPGRLNLRRPRVPKASCRNGVKRSRGGRLGAMIGALIQQLSRHSGANFCSGSGATLKATNSLLSPSALTLHCGARGSPCGIFRVARSTLDSRIKSRQCRPSPTTAFLALRAASRMMTPARSSAGDVFSGNSMTEEWVGLTRHLPAKDCDADQRALADAKRPRQAGGSSQMVVCCAP